jgi:endonuclease/exonuclease/phosphatase family metal-dependent hydrolase
VTDSPAMRRLRGGLLVLSVCLLAGCSSGGGEKSTKAPELTLRVMTFNIFYGGDEMKLPERDWCSDPAGCQDTFALVADAIRRAHADVVGLQEATGNTSNVAQALGWNYSERTQIISRFPIIDPGGADGLYVYVQPTADSVVAVSNVHLPATPYGPYQAQNGKVQDDVVALEERARLPAIAEQVGELPKLAQQKVPVFLTGDFNSPSYLDWTPAADAARDEMPYPVEWPVSKALADAGFRDSFRVVHEDPVAKPGFTWTPGGPESAKHEVHDRIDWVLSMGPARAVASSVVGEASNENTDIALGQWPSDHRSVVSTFRVTPAATPEFAAVETRSVVQGEDIQARFHSSRAGETVVLRPTGAGSGREISGPTDEPTDGLVGVATDESTAPGEYEVVLLDPNKDPISTSTVYVYEPGSQTTISTSKGSYQAGGAVEVSWTDAPGMKWDWVAVFPAGDGANNPRAGDCPTGTCGNGNYLVYKYTHASIEGSTTFWGLEPGAYDVRLLLDDAYSRAAISEPFKIVQP